MNIEIDDFKEMLLAKYEARRFNDPTLSFRKFALSIGVSPSNLSDVFKGRCGLSEQVAMKIAERLQMSGQERQHWLDLVESRHSRSRAGREAATRRLAERQQRPFRETANANEMNLVEHWYYVAAFELVELTRGQINAESLAYRLSISVEEARDAFAALIGMNLLKIENDRFVRVRKELAVETPTPSVLVQNYHRQILELAAQSLEGQPMERRHFTTTMLTFDSARIDEAKAFFKSVDDEFFKRFEAKETGDSVYACGTQFFQIDREGGNA